MKVLVISLNEEGLESRDYMNELQINVNGEKKFYVGDGEPEDSNLSRDFSDCWNIPDLMKLAYEAGKNGESLEIEYEEREEI